MSPRRLLPAAALAAAALLQGGCSERIAGTPVPLVLAGVEVASLVTLQRGVFDTAYSLITGRDCSIVHIERRGEYCRTEAEPAPEFFCTRSLADVDCWTVTNPYGRQQPTTDRPAVPDRRAVPWALSPF